MLLQAQPSLQRLFLLMPHLWKEHSSHPEEADILDLTGEDSDAKHDTGHHSKSNLLWMSTALEWGPFCPQATVMHWAEAMLQVSVELCRAWELYRKAQHSMHSTACTAQHTQHSMHSMAPAFCYQKLS